VLIFGGKLAPYILNLFAEALHWIIQRHIPELIQHYLDNFLSIFKPSMPPQLANSAIDWVVLLAEDLGLSFQPKKNHLTHDMFGILGSGTQFNSDGGSFAHGQA